MQTTLILPKLSNALRTIVNCLNHWTLNWLSLMLFWRDSILAAGLNLRADSLATYVVSLVISSSRRKPNNIHVPWLSWHVDAETGTVGSSWKYRWCPDQSKTEDCLAQDLSKWCRLHYHHDIFEAWHDEIFQQLTSNATCTNQQNLTIGYFVVQLLSKHSNVVRFSIVVHIKFTAYFTSWTGEWWCSHKSYHFKRVAPVTDTAHQATLPMLNVCIWSIVSDVLSFIQSPRKSKRKSKTSSGLNL